MQPFFGVSRNAPQKTAAKETNCTYDYFENSHGTVFSLILVPPTFYIFSHARYSESPNNVCEIKNID